MRIHRWIWLAALTVHLAGCGGGGGSSSGGGGGGPPPSATITSAALNRMVVAGTSVHATVTLSLNFTPTGTFKVQVPSSPPTPFQPDVTIVSSSGGTYTLDVVTSSAAAAAHYSGNATLNLCADANCKSKQAVSTVTLPYTVDVLADSNTWLGDHQTPLSALAGAPDWSTFQGNSAHTGFVPVNLDADTVTTRWRIAGMGGISGFTGMPQTVATSGGSFFVSGAQMLSARRESDASVIWSYDFSGLQYPSANPPAVSGGTVYVAAGQQSSTFLFAFDAAGGSLVFKSPMASQWEHYLAPAVGPFGVYTNSGTYGGLYAFAQSGDSLFFKPDAQTSLWSPAVDANAVYVYTGGQLSVIDPVTGATRVVILDPTFTNYTYEIDGSPVLGDSGLVFAANYINSLLNGGSIGNTLTAFDVTHGTIAWQVAGDYPSTPAYQAGRLYAANERPLRLEVRTATSGALEWSWVPPASADTDFVSEVLVTNNLLFVSTNHALYALDLASHQVAWSYPESGHLALSANGVLYLQSPTRITAFNLK